jgi:hypothetical protein
MTHVNRAFKSFQTFPSLYEAKPGDFSQLPQLKKGYLHRSS